MLGTVLYVFSQCVRTLGWDTILRASYPEATSDLSRWDTVRAYLAGSGLNAVIPARGGDASSSRSCTATSRARAGRP